MGSVLCGPIADHATVGSIGSFCHELSILQGSHMYCPPTTLQSIENGSGCPIRVHAYWNGVRLPIFDPLPIFSDKYSVKSLLSYQVLLRDLFLVSPIY